MLKELVTKVGMRQRPPFNFVSFHVCESAYAYEVWALRLSLIYRPTYDTETSRCCWSGSNTYPFNQVIPALNS